MKYRVHVDEDVCIGAGECEMVAPGTFEVGDDGVSHVLDPRGDSEEALLQAEKNCPSGAISVRGVDEDGEA